MNMNRNPTKNELQEILRKCDDDAAHHILWVSYDSEVQISPVPEDLTPVGWAEQNNDKIKWRNETWVRGNKYVGPDAADDDNWVDKLFSHLKKQMELNTTGYVDTW